MDLSWSGGPLSAFGLGLPRRLVRSDTGGSGPRLGPTQVSLTGSQEGMEGLGFRRLGVLGFRV